MLFRKVNVFTERIAGIGGYTNSKSILLDGVDECINIDSLQSSIASNTTGTISIWVKPVDATPSSNERPLSFGDANAATVILCSLRTNGQLDFLAQDGGAVQWRLDTDNAELSDNTRHHVALVQDGTSPVLYVDGVAVDQTFSTSTDKTVWFNDLAGIDNGRIGCFNFNNTGNVGFFNGNIDEFLYTSDAKSAAEISNIYNSGTPKDESAISNGVSYYRFGDASGDNYNSGVANEWQFIDQIGSNNIFTVNVEEADVEEDTP